MSSLGDRRSVRLGYWDYSRPGYYFLTICCHDRQCLFGSIRDGKMELSQFGQVVIEELQRSVEIRSELTIDAVVVMPNHLHIIAVITRSDSGTLGYKRDVLVREKRSISSFIAAFKAAVTARVNTLRQTPGVPVWQRGFHDHIVRSEESLAAIRQYLVDNPRQWELDKLHPDAQTGARDALDEIIERDALIPLL